ncbi:hypothetical protein SPRG_10788 [Saprolegnia parasitica CBS 223.65]|uniref:Secreted protein n=1 Tax=Saprolegnia parasitica (strain CBS 223.65) TaxID=695850 RepID=A0A067BZ89_SAPPC|nr:hypothetical protein SPRG_10788 [Saprolegnia parasitica CBS 223.65]KDO23593.1 hypothetical protein SPRG_10788 [Saprolegnia parasitica CBS 223.65]|eukprot:XP_012205741.1 hypothetical protein SPRG_10788 [Saprolegnia parasitica CBS 223.65]
MTPRALLVLLALVAVVAAVDIKIKRKPRTIREPIAIREPAPFRTGLLDDKTEPLTKYASVDHEMGDVTMHLFHNITFLSPTKKVLLGLWKGYEVDEASMRYRALLFDDGDLCPQDRSKRYSVRLELARRDYEGMREYIQSVETTSEPCQLKLHLEFYAPEARLTLPPEHVEHVASWYEDPTSPKVLCKSIKCDYATVQDQVDAIAMSVQALQVQIDALASPLVADDTAVFVQSTLDASNAVLSAATSVLGTASRVYARLAELQPTTTTCTGPQ